MKVNDGNKNGENVSIIVDAKIDVLLQTADCKISKSSETKSLKLKGLLDPGLQKRHLFNTVRDFLQLDTISKQNLQIKAFADTEGQLKELGEFKFVLRGWNGNGLQIYLSGFSVPVVYRSVNGKKLNL